MLGRFREGIVLPLRHGGVHPFGVKSRSVGQSFMQEALTEEAPPVIVQGPAGAAKTFSPSVCKITPLCGYLPPF